VLIAAKPGKLNVTFSEPPKDTGRILNGVRHILRLDDDLRDFYDAVESDERLSWIADMNAGRLLRSATVWEDLVKTICTTNCSWALTRKMVVNLVSTLGTAAADGKRTFPTAEAMATQGVDF